jgi:hypothetical protein
MKLTLPRLVIAITFLGIVAMAVRPSADTDTWWHLRVGAWIVEHRAVPMVDPFSHTRAGTEWKIPGWLVQVPLYLLFANFGYAGLNLFTAACVTLTFVFIYQCCEGNAFVKAFTLILAAAASAIYWSARPQIVSFLLAGAFAYILHLYRWQRVNRLWVLPSLMALWANVHGGFALGFILLGLTVAGESVSFLWRLFTAESAERAKFWSLQFEVRSSGAVGPRGIIWLTAIGLLCALAVSFNPAGPAMLLYPFKTVSIGVLRDFIQEWQSPDFHQVNAQIFLWLLFGTLAAVGLSRRRINFTDLVLVTGCAYLGFLAWRNVVLLAIIAPPVITRHVAWGWAEARGQVTARAEANPSGGGILLNWAILLVVALTALVKISISIQPALNAAEAARLVPVGAAEYIQRERPKGRLFNSYNFGAYLTWALYPAYPVYVDGRTDLYDGDFLREYLSVALARPGYEAVLSKYGVNVAVVESNSLISDALARDGWRAMYDDPLATVYERARP